MRPMEFLSIDVETANADMLSICQIGIASFRDGVLVGEWETLIDPEDYFDPINVSVHGIEESDVLSAPKLIEVFAKITSLLPKKSVLATRILTVYRWIRLSLNTN
jgi:DNA polymerase-3 subunit epsilon